MNEEKINKILEENKIILFMKGNKLFPQCGFSAKVVEILDSLNIEYKDIDILQDEELRQDLKVYSNWPTFPQLYVNKELIGGCDIIVEMFEKGDLKDVVK